MDSQDRQAIEGLFARLGEVERQAGNQDAGAQALIKERIAQQPGAPYFMAQTIVMLDYALRNAQQRIEELERQQAERPAGGGLLSGLLGGGQNAGRTAGSVPAIARGPAPDVAAPPPAQPGRGGFLAGAAQTAMGVAGGVLLGNAIGGMFGGNEAKAAETAPASVAEPASDEGGGFFDNIFGGGDDEG
jgi:uncharacterized protein